jgi:dTDP-glucose 4,6-dehydratase
MKIVIITGCLGFMGSYFARKALQRGWQVRGVDKVTYAANLDLLKEFNEYPNFQFEKLDIKDMTHLYDCDYIVNFAAESHVGNSIVNSDDFINSNVLGVKNLLDLIRFKPINCGDKPILFHISTDEVYGDITSGAHVETDILKPSNPYSAAKASGDMLINAWARTYGLEYLILRPTNNYGIGQYPEKLIPLSVKNLKRGKKINLHDQGEPIRNWLHADDTAEAVMAIIDSGNVNEVYNVAGGFEQPNYKTVRKIIEAYFGTHDDWKQYVNFDSYRKGQDVRYALNDRKLKNLGWEPKKKFDEEIERIVHYYKKVFIW